MKRKVWTLFLGAAMLCSLAACGSAMTTDDATRDKTPYINGVETARTSFGGVCEVPLYLIISVGVDENIADNEFLPASMVVDYVRCYQYK